MTTNRTPQRAPLEAGDIVFETRLVTPEEVAAVSAVVVSAAGEQASALDDSEHRGQDAWQKSQRTLRAPLVPGVGAWRGFTP
ncbi:MAG TPA: acyl-CoA carboxylase epsilon subunit [Microbacteriaceae bacterium]|nr:acyl-CoA carboxylase epsilon subunit [Microbacteriaceae bacterium]